MRTYTEGRVNALVDARLREMDEAMLPSAADAEGEGEKENEQSA